MGGGGRSSARGSADVCMKLRRDADSEVAVGEYIGDVGMNASVDDKEKQASNVKKSMIECGVQ